MSQSQVTVRFDLLPTRWGVTVEPMGAGDEFADEPCGEGYDAVLWHFAGPDEAEMLTDEGIVPPTKSPGGNLGTSFSWSPVSQLFTAFSGESVLGEDIDEGILVGIHVCVNETPEMVEADDPEDLDAAKEERVYVLDPAWENDFASFELQGEYRQEEVVAYRVSRTYDLPDSAPDVETVLTPLADLGMAPDIPDEPEDQPDPAEQPDESQPAEEEPSAEPDTTPEPTQDQTATEPEPDDGAGQETTTTTTTTTETEGGTFIETDTVEIAEAEDVDINIRKTTSGDGDGMKVVEIGVPGAEDAVENIRGDVEARIDEAIEELTGSEPSQSPEQSTQPEQQTDDEQQSLDDILSSAAEDTGGSGGSGTPEGGGSDTPNGAPPADASAEEIADYAEREYDLSTYQDFSTKCLSHYDASTCGDVWGVLKDRGVTGGSGNEQPEDGAGGGLVGSYDVGQSVLLTRPGCPDCEQVKQQDSVQQGLADGSLVEVRQGDPDYEPIVLAADVESVPEVVMRTQDGFE